MTDLLLRTDMESKSNACRVFQHTILDLCIIPWWHEFHLHIPEEPLPYPLSLLQLAAWDYLVTQNYLRTTGCVGQEWATRHSSQTIFFLFSWKLQGFWLSSKENTPFASRPTTFHAQVIQSHQYFLPVLIPPAFFLFRLNWDYFEEIVEEKNGCFHYPQGQTLQKEHPDWFGELLSFVLSFVSLQILANARGHMPGDKHNPCVFCF